MPYHLTEGALATILNGGVLNNLVVQILEYDKIGSENSNERYKLLISDGRHQYISTLVDHLNVKVMSGELSNNSIIIINKHMICMAKRPVIVILQLTVLATGSQVGYVIGNPQLYNGPFSAAPASYSTFQDDSDDVDIKPIIASCRASIIQPKDEPPEELHLSNIQLVDEPPEPLTLSNIQPMDEPPQELTLSPGNIQRAKPISCINPYLTGASIKARVTTKTPIKTWSSARGEGKLFSVSLLDESGEIRATAFNQDVDNFYDMLEVKHIYYLSGFDVNVAKKEFTSIKHDFEISFTSNTVVFPCLEDLSIPTASFEFVPISNLTELNLNSVVDVIGVCKSVEDLQTFTARTKNRELKKRDATLIDQTHTSVTLTLWGEQAEEFDGSQQPVIAVKGGKINEFQGGRSVSLLQQSTLHVNPDIPEAHRLRHWYNNVGRTIQSPTSISSPSRAGVGFTANFMTLKEAQDSHLGTGDRADYFTCKATVVMIRSERATYKACPNMACNKKVIEQGNGLYRCEKCNMEFPNFKYRFLLSVNLSDWTTNQWVMCFQEVGEQILGVTARELGVLEDQNNDLHDSLCRAGCFKTFIFKICAKMEFYNNERRMKMTLVGAKRVDYKEYNTRLLDEIRELL